MYQIKRILTFFLCCFPLLLLGQGQPYLSESWTGSGGLTAVFSHNTTKTDDLLNVYVAGSTLDTNNYHDIIVQKFHANGTLLWQKIYNSPTNLNDMAADIYIDESYNVYVTGTTVKTILNSYDLVVLKYSSSGTLLWEYWYNNGGSPSPDDGGTAITGYGEDIFVTGASFGDTTLSDYVTISLDSADGQMNWVTRYDYDQFNEIPNKIAVEEGEVMVSGASQISADSWKLAVISYNADDGDFLSLKRSGGTSVSGTDKLYDLAIDDNHYVYAVGAIVNSGTGYDIALYKLDEDLGLVWDVSFEGYGGVDKGHGVKVDASGNVYIAGYVTRPGQGKNFSLLKYNSSGILQWSREYNGQVSGDDEAVQLVIDGDHIFITGTAYNSSYSDYQTVLYASNGDIITQASYKGPAGLNDKPSAMAIDSSGNIIVVGQTQELSGFANRTVKYSFYEKPVDIIYENGYASHNSHELLIRFDRSAIIYAAIDKKDFQAGKLMDFVKPAVLTAMQSKTGFDWSRFPTYKIFRRITTRDSLSVTRLGDTIPLDDFWATLSVYLPTDDNDTIIDSLMTMYPVIHYAELNYVGELQCNANDSICNASFNDPTYGINLDGAWNRQVGQSYTKVGIFDSGVEWRHEDFGDTIIGTKVKEGWDYNLWMTPYNQSFPDYLSHGTRVAGIIGAIRNNTKGISGIAGGDFLAGNTGCELYGLKIYGIDSTSANSDDGYYDSISMVSNISEAIVDGAIESVSGELGFGLHIQNHSWGVLYNSLVMSDAVKTCYLNGVAFVVSSGNVDEPAGIFEQTLMYPASYDDNWVIKVGSVGFDGVRSSFSVYNNNLDIIAPGEYGSFKTTDNLFDRYEYDEGTSFSAPHVTGICALMHSQHHVNNGYPNNLAPEDYEYFLEHFAKDVYVHLHFSKWGMMYKLVTVL